MTPRVMLVNDFRTAGGAERYVEQLGNLLQERGIEVELFALDDHDHLRRPSLLEMSVGLQAYRSLMSVIDSFEPTVAHLNNLYHRLSPLGHWLLARHVRERPIRLVWTLHDGYLLCPDPLGTTTSRNGTRRQVRRFDHLNPLVWSRSAPASIARWMRWTLGWPGRAALTRDAIVIVPSRGLRDLVATRTRGLVMHIPNFPPVGADSTTTAPAAAEDRSGFLFVGGDHPGKGLEILATHGSTIFLDQLEVVGMLSDAGRSRIDTIARDRGATPRLVGHVPPDRCRQLISRSKALIVPTQGLENASLAIADALALNTPIVIGRMNGLARDLANHPGVTIYDSLSPEETKAVTTCLARGRAVSTDSTPSSVFVDGDTHVQKILGAYGIGDNRSW